MCLFFARSIIYLGWQNSIFGECIHLKTVSTGDSGDRFSHIYNSVHDTRKTHIHMRIHGKSKFNFHLKHLRKKKIRMPAPFIKLHILYSGNKLFDLLE